MLLNCGLSFNSKFFRIKSSLNKKLMMKTGQDRYLSNHRFWTEIVQLKSSLSSKNDLDDTIESLNTVLKHCENVGRRLDVGVVFAPQSNYMIPIHDGMLQRQHLTTIPSNIKSNIKTIAEDKDKAEEVVVVVGFAPRASTVTEAPDALDRKVIPERVKAIHEALSRFESINIEELTSDSLSGTPPSRIYRSFIAPRKDPSTYIEPLDRAANRTALQIDLAWRQVKADQSSYLRNNDKPLLELMNDNNNNNNNNVKGGTHPIIIVCDNIRSAFNVGSIFRSAETAGVAGVLTCGITAHPPHPKLRKTAMSAIDAVPSQHYDDTLACIRDLQSQGIKVFALETTNNAKLYTNIDYKAYDKIALVAGNEVTGVGVDVMSMVDDVIQIPVFGIKNSLNVASALPIVLFEVVRQLNINNNSNSNDNDNSHTNGNSND